MECKEAQQIKVKYSKVKLYLNRVACSAQRLVSIGTLKNNVRLKITTTQHRA